MSTSILIADDQALVRAGFRMILEAEPDFRILGETKDGADAVDAAHRCHPDVVLMDIRMPRIDGLEATRRIIAAGKAGRPRVLMLTTFDLDEYVYDALTAGASGFLLKDAPPEQLVAGVLSKLGLRDRVEAVVLAYETGIAKPGSTHATAA